MTLTQKFYQDRYLHIRSFTLWFVGAVIVCAALVSLRPDDFYAFSPELWHLLLIPLGIYIGGISAVFIHNATHDSFPNKWLNAAAGHLSGFHQLWGFMGWKLIHLLHHHYSDNVEMDTHPPKGKTFWQFTKTMFLYSSAVVSKRYREHWGEGLKTKILHKGVLVMFLGMATCNLLGWFLLLGPEGFVFFYIPSYIANHLLFADINYHAHPVNEKTGETEAANFDSTLYHKLANACWFGIYYHGNHHRKPKLFNPKYMPVSERRRAAMGSSVDPYLPETGSVKEKEQEAA